MGTPGSSFPIVALGTSAGGLAAVTQLLKGLGEKPGFAVVLVQHLDPTYASSLVELLAKVTPMSVEAVREGTRVVVDHVYVIPPAAEMTIERGVLHLTPRSEGHAPHLPIDRFFDSLAEDSGPGAVAVVLSGTASDGARGVQAIKAEGGITFAQDRAEHPGMPDAAIATGCVDFVLRVDAIAAELTRIAARPVDGRAAPGEEDASLERILTAIRRGTGVDFTHYKPTTLRRRMQRRAVLRRVGSLREYADLVTAEPAEAEALSEEVLIHVTSFFRDPEVFEALKKTIFPRMLAARKGDALRVWVAGCSTGEEVYSIAICLAEFLEEAGAPQTPVKMFGTDVSRRAIERARAGIYPDLISEDVTPARLARYFVKTERGYEILKEVRDRCVFATHDIARDPPFSKMDLISCRNMMIYLSPTLQQRILQMFHYAMNEPGFLLLGVAETVGPFVGFTAADAKQRIYARAPGPVRLQFEFGDVRGWSAPAAAAPRPDRATSLGEVRKDADRAILSTLAPAGVVVTNDLAIVEFRGEMAPYLEPIPGVATLDLLRMAREELRLPLRRAIDEARSAAKRSRTIGVSLGSSGARRTVDIDVIPFEVPPGGTRFFAVLFTEGPMLSADVEAPPADAANVAVEDSLRHELASTREYLQSVIEQLEGGNEELKAANEEIVSSNEELQSTNEELQTAKEELQATNEELHTVNDEMLERNVETTRLADDLSNVLSSVAIPIVILGREARIRRFTPAATKILNLIPADVGRPITDIQAKIRIPELTSLIGEVLEHLAPLERTVQAEDGRWHQLGIRPYRTMDNRIDGVVLSVYDIDALKKAELLLAEARDYAESIVSAMRESLVVIDADLRVRTANPAFCQQFQATPAQIVGQRFDAICERQLDAPEIARLLAGLARGEPMDEIRFDRHVGASLLSMVVNGRRMSKTDWILLTVTDITDRVLIDRARTEDRLARNEAGFRRMLTSAAEAILMSDTNGRIVFANDTAVQIFGYTDGEMLGIQIDALIPDRLGEGTRDHDRVALRKDGTRFPVEVALTPMDGMEGTLDVAFVNDVTLRREAEAKIKDYQGKLQQMAFEAALAEERERRRIAQDLHDRVGQSLALARIKLDVVRDVAAKDVQPAIVAAIELISTSIDDTRTLTFDLAPPVLYDLGLKPALAWLCEDIEKRTGVHVEIADDGNQPRFEEATAALLFRAVRELLTNVFKHAQAPTARVALEQSGDHFQINVEDAGAGFDVERLAHGPGAGFGLFSVREQIARLGGTVEIESMPRRGTRVSLRVPVTTGEPRAGSGEGGHR